MSKYDGVLYLPIKTKWLNMIKVGFKKEEYREIKPYWAKRLTNHFGDFVDYHKVIFHNYGKNLPVYADVVNIRIGKPKSEWTDKPGIECFVIEIDEALVDLPF